jgi:hypothetical protein
VIDPVATGATAASGSLAAAAGGPATNPAKPDAVSRGFEKLLVEQLAKELLATTGDTGNQYASLLPDALADAVEDGGGIGLDLKANGS